jgi:hypothetical protein
MMVNTENKVGAQDVQNNYTYHAAEGGIEKMTADISTLFTNTLSPLPSDITVLATNPGPPNISGITWPTGGYVLSPVMDPTNPNKMLETPGTVSSGPFAGLGAQLLQVNLQATAQGMLGDEVQMNRTVEVALIPVFQFGIFSDGDLAFFTNPSLTFSGNIHTNGDLYLGCAGGNTCTFTNKISAYGNVIRANIPNGQPVANVNDQGTVQIPGAPGGCSGAKPACTNLPTSGNLWGSVTGAGGNPAASSYNSGPPTWMTISLNTWTSTNKYLGGMMIDGNYGASPNTGAKNMTLPFVSGATLSATPGLGNPPGPQNYEIIRRAPPGESSTTPLGASRLYNQAAIRVLLSDTPEELPGGPGDPDNVRLANVVNPHGTGVDYSKGVPTVQPNLGVAPVGESWVTYFATASALAPNPSSTAQVTESGVKYFTASADWPFAPITSLGEFNQEFDSVDETVDQAQGFPYLFSNGPSKTVAPNPVNLCVVSACNPSPTAYPYYTPPQLDNSANANDSQWNLIDGYLRVEFLPQNGACPGPGANVNGYCAITREWLGLGFARGITPPTTPGFPWTGAATQNPANPYAILILQEPKRAADGVLDTLGTQPKCTLSAGVYTCTGKPPDVVTDFTTGSAYQGETPFAVGNLDPTVTAFNWYPINFYDAREGEPDDLVQANNSCTPIGIMNAVELDVGNLNQWLKGNIPGSGTLVNFTNQNGYVLYFSDRRGMLPNPNGTQTVAGGTNYTNISGDAGFEDVVNRGSGTRAPDGLLEPAPAGKKLSPEDANLNGLLDNFGAKNLGLELGYIGGNYTLTKNVNALVNTNPPNPYLTTGRIPSCSVAKNVWISGARHALKLVDGSLGNLPTVPGGVFPTTSGGFTVGSENPVYVVGNYNTNCPAIAAGNGCTPGNNTVDPNWPTPPAAAGQDPPHAAASITADTVTLLSNSWSDWNSILLQPTQPTPNRSATLPTYYRMAIATGNVQPFPLPTWAQGNDNYGIGTDGGVGNFLRLLEDWSPGAGTTTLYYQGSMVNLFYSTYNTGLFKCCNYAVYNPPTRRYYFDQNFNTFSELPPGTPMFKDVDNLSYRQSFTACTVGANNRCSN